MNAMCDVRNTMTKIQTEKSFTIDYPLWQKNGPPALELGI